MIYSTQVGSTGDNLGHSSEGVGEAGCGTELVTRGLCANSVELVSEMSQMGVH